MKTLDIKSLLTSLCQREAQPPSSPFAKGEYPSLAKRGEGRFYNIYVFFLLCLLLTFLVFPASGPEAITVDKVIAKVNNEVVTLSDYMKFVPESGNSAGKESVDEILLRKLIDEKIILQEAAAKGLDATEAETDKLINDFMKQNSINKEELTKNLAGEGMSYAEYRQLIKENIISLKIIDREVNSKIIVTDKEISEHYNKNLNLFRAGGEKYQIDAILFRLGENPSMTEVTDLKIKSMKTWSRIKNGESFEKIVGQYLKGTQGNVDEISGDFEKGELIALLDNEVVKMKDGDVAKPVWTKEGVYILKLIKRTKESYYPLDKVRSQIYLTLHDQKREKKFNEWVKALWVKSSVKIILP